MDFRDPHPSHKNKNVARVGYPEFDPCGTAKEHLNKYQIQENNPSGAKAHVDYAGFSGTAEAVPFQNMAYSELP
jgi:hypothetical protein